MASDTQRAIPHLRVDGGASANNLLMQHQADVLGIPVTRGQVIETTALGVAFLAGLAVGFWRGKEDLRKVWREDRTFAPMWTPSRRESEMLEWIKSVKKSRLRE
jgi:glycerol kinase